MLDLLSLLPLQSPSSSPTKVSQHHAMISCFCVRYYWRVMDTEHRFSLPTRRLILNCLVPLLGSATMEQQRVPAKHLRLVQLLRIRLRQAMLRYLVAWISEAAPSLESSDSFPLLCLFSLTIYLTAQQRTTNIRHQHLLLPQVIQRLWVSKLSDALPLEYISCIAIDLLACLWRASIIPCILSCAYICIVFHCQLIVSFFTVCLLFSALLQWLRYNGSATMTQSSVAFKESQPSTYG